MTNKNTESHDSKEERIECSTPGSNEKKPEWKQELKRDLQWTIEMHGRGEDALDQEKAWTPMQTVIKDMRWNRQMVLQLFRQHGLLLGEKSWHPALLENGLITVISYTESCGLTGYEGKVELALLSIRGKSFLEDFLQYAYPTNLKGI
jgi:hypothetical protein